MPHLLPPGIPTPDEDLTLTSFPTPDAVDIEIESFPIFVAVAFKGIESQPLLFDVATTQYLAKMCCKISDNRFSPRGGGFNGSICKIPCIHHPPQGGGGA